MTSELVIDSIDDFEDIVRKTASMRNGLLSAYHLPINACRQWLKLLPDIRKKNPPSGGEDFHRWMADYIAAQIGKTLMRHPHQTRGQRVKTQWWDTHIDHYAVLLRELENRLPGCAGPDVELTTSIPFP